MNYCGRFAPSPSGRLHWGSLISGYVSYFRAQKQQGKFIIRIEDLDFPRCPKINTPIILQELELLGITSDCPPIIQSEQLANYQEVLNKLIESKQAYYCTCSRALMKERPCSCNEPDLQATIAQGSLDDVAIRIDLSSYLPKHKSFVDGHLGLIEQDSLEHEIAHSLVLKRADNIIAYNLAAVIDDHQEGITEVVRGADMLDATFLQLCLYEILGYQAPSFFHVPLIVDRSGNKLSKQNKASAVLCSRAPHHALTFTYRFLRQDEFVALPLQFEMDRLYLSLHQFIEQNVHDAYKSGALDNNKLKPESAFKLISKINTNEHTNALLSYGYYYLDNGVDLNFDDLEELIASDYIEPKLLGYTLVKFAQLDLDSCLPLIKEYRSLMNELLWNLCERFNELKMPHSPIMI